MVRQSGPGDTVAWEAMDVCRLARRRGLRDPKQVTEQGMQDAEDRPLDLG